MSTELNWLEAENERLREVVNDQAATISRLHQDIKRLHETLASQYLTFKAETARIWASKQEDEAAPI